MLFRNQTTFDQVVKGHLLKALDSIYTDTQKSWENKISNPNTAVAKQVWTEHAKSFKKCDSRLVGVGFKSRI